MAAKVFDIEASMERVAEDKELLCELIGICLEEKLGRLAAIRAAIDAGDAKGLDREAHAIKSALGNVGAMVCHEIAGSLERAGKSGDLTDAQALLVRFETEFVLFEEEFEKFKNS